MLKVNLFSYNLMGDILKKIFEFIGLLSLACFSFFYTSKISTVIKDTDSIYKQIKEIKEQYKIEAIDAKIEGNTIIPGLSGSEIDVEESYKKMKKINSFNDNLLVYKSIKPNISIEDNYDKYIISGNKNKKQVALLFLVSDNDNINYILDILEKYKVEATFYTDGYWFENNNELIIKIIDLGHNIGNLGYLNNYNNSSVNWMNNTITKLTNQKNTFCYSEKENEQILKICSSNKSYTIRPNIIISNNPLIEIKQNIKNGSIIALNINKNIEKELPLIIEYINSKDLELVNIETFLEE